MHFIFLRQLALETNFVNLINVTNSLCRIFRTFVCTLCRKEFENGEFDEVEQSRTQLSCYNYAVMCKLNYVIIYLYKSIRKHLTRVHALYAP